MRIDPAIATSSPAATRTDPAAPTTIDRAAEGFEAWFVGFLAHEALGKGLLQGKGAETFSGFFEQEIGRVVAEGAGIGLADELREAMGQLPREDGALPAPGPRSGSPLGAVPGGRVTSGYGTRFDPIDGERRQHDGIDVAAPTGTPIHAPRDGVVRFAGTRGGYGNVVVLDHGDGTETRYAHCDSLSVKEGQVVRGGAVIAAVGATGRATGPHVHVELRRDGHAIDPTREVTNLLTSPSASVGDGSPEPSDSSSKERSP